MEMIRRGGPCIRANSDIGNRNRRVDEDIARHLECALTILKARAASTPSCRARAVQKARRTHSITGSRPIAPPFSTSLLGFPHRALVGWGSLLTDEETQT